MTTTTIRGAGGKSGGSARVATEVEDSLRSAQFANVIDVISEGEIVGLVDGLRSVYLDGTPIQGPGTEMNFKGVSHVATTGQQDQGHLPFEPVSVTVAVGTKVAKAVPIVRTISNSEIDWVTVTLGTPRMSFQDPSNGDILGSKVAYTIELQSAGGGFQSVHVGEIVGKTNSRYQRQVKINLPGSGPWDVRVTRSTDDALTSNISNDLYWDSYTSGIDVKLKYPNTAAVMLRLDSEQFDSIPVRGYDIRGMIVRVPSNYNPETRVYTGAWNGTFKLAWTNNPAWCFYDMLTNSRYGLGDYLSADQIDKWTLYSIGRYCDQLVPSGFGYDEPRFTCNLYLQTQEDAYKVINSMASIFRAMAFWANDQITASQDAPSDPVANFTPANVLNGDFNYQGADRRARHSVALVSWNDPADMYRQKIEYVSDDAAIARWGVVQTEVVAVGCTSRGQAHRVAKWLIYTEQHESETITFKAGMDSAQLCPGAIIRTNDPVRSGKRMGGRLVGQTLNSVSLDSPIEIETGQVYELILTMPDLTVITRTPSNAPGTHAVLNFALALPSLPEPSSMWLLSATNIEPELWRVITVTESEPTVVDVTAIAHDPNKYAFVEQGIVLEPRATTGIPTRPPAVTEVTHQTELYLVNDGIYSTRISLGWAASRTAVAYRITWRRGEGNYKTEQTSGTNFEINGVAAGVFRILIAPVNALGKAGEEVEITHTVDASAISPDVTGLSLNPNFSSHNLPFKWDMVPGTVAYEVQVRDPTSGVLLREASVKGTEFTYFFTMNQADGGPRRSLRVRVRAKTLVGTSANWTEAVFSNPAPAAPTGISLEAGPGQVSIFAERPSDPDLAGMLVWVYADSTVPTTAENLTYQGSDNAYMKTGLKPGIPVFFKVAFYDAFGAVALNYSTSMSAIPLASGGVQIVTELPASPEDVAGELALFLNVADPLLRGMHGWSGTEWVNVTKLLDGSVTSDKLAPGAVDFAALAVGAVQARNLSINKHFIY